MLLRGASAIRIDLEKLACCYKCGSRARRPRSLLITHYQIPVKIGDTIKPGDVVLGDIDGVLVVPRAIAFDVLLRAEEIKANEKFSDGWPKGKAISDHGKRRIFLMSLIRPHVQILAEGLVPGRACI